MPRLFDGSGQALDPRSIDVAAYLASLGADAVSNEGPAEPGGLGQAAQAEIDRGSQLFEQLGCVACHTFAEPTDELRSLRRVGQKWHASALARFLLEPRRHHPATRMPDFFLSAHEAQALASLVLSMTKQARLPAVDFSGADLERGAELLTRSRCLHCHSLGDTDPTPVRIGFGEAGGGCLSRESPTPGLPSFDLSDDQTAAITRLLTEAPGALSRVSPIDSFEREWTRLQCNACHERDGLQDRWSTVVSEVGPELSDPTDEPAPLRFQRPDLTYAGEKLRADWVERLVGGEVKRSLRPWMGSRMPSFATAPATLARGLAAQHGRSRGPLADGPPASHQMLEAGEHLVSTAGLACVTCHDHGDQEATAVFDARGPDLLSFSERIWPDYFMRFMARPSRDLPGTKMPAYSDNGRSSDEVLGGDAEQQFQSIWAYLAESDRER
jgi:cytochrome c2